MSAELFYGSSEYSPQAEELFARYVRSLEAGEEPAFEDYCAQHPNLADELHGLHTDWDNVRGLLSKMKDLGRAGQTAESSTLDLNCAPLQDDLQAPSKPRSRSSGLRFLLASLSLLGLVTLGVWNRKLVLGQQVLAQERDQIAAQGQTTAQQLLESQVEGERLLEHGRVLDQELGLERLEKEHLNLAHSKLLERDGRLQAEHEKLGQEHRLLGEEVVWLEESNALLNRSVESEKLALEQARAIADEHKRGLDALALLTEIDELTQSEPRHWPASAELVAGLQAWLLEAGRLQSKQAFIQESLAELASNSSVLHSMLSRLDALTRAGGRIELAQRRLEFLLQLQADPDGIHAKSWAAALEGIADGAESPHYHGLQLNPQFGLQSLGPDPNTGLWRFADLSTGRASESGGGHGGMVYWLIPGSSAGDAQQAAFLLLAELPSAEQLSFAGIQPVDEKAGSTQQILGKFALHPPYDSQLELLRKSNLEPAAWAGRPVRELAD